MASCDCLEVPSSVYGSRASECYLKARGSWGYRGYGAFLELVQMSYTSESINQNIAYLVFFAFSVQMSPER